MLCHLLYTSKGTEADPGLQAVNLDPVVASHYFLPGLHLPSQLLTIIFFRPVPNYGLWTEARVNDLPRFIT